ncbi:MAG: hypothetical protein ACI94Y_003870, partial [Maribacter sp.]
KFTALYSLANWDMTVKIVVPTLGNFEDIFMIRYSLNLTKTYGSCQKNS